jgi:hypothetical protein
MSGQVVGADERRSVMTDVALPPPPSPPVVAPPPSSFGGGGKLWAVVAALAILVVGAIGMVAILQSNHGAVKAVHVVHVPGTPAPATPGPSDAGGRVCGAGVAALNAGTSCPFALNVAAAYYGSGQQGTVQVYSPVTHQTYSMSCTAGHPHTCSGGNNAQVSVP